MEFTIEQSDLTKHQVKVYKIIESLEDYADKTSEILISDDLLNTLQRAIEAINK